MKFRRFLRHRIPLREIIVAHYPGLHRLQEAGERVGVVVRHGWEKRHGVKVPYYFSDASYPRDCEGSRHTIPTEFRELFVYNCRTRDPRVTALPRGVLANHHPWRLAVAGLGAAPRHLVYGNFSLGKTGLPAYTASRKKVYDTLKDRDWITFENVGNQHGEYDLRQIAYYHRVAQHRFTISPEGNGVDCWRTWEALYLKSVPIVQRSPEMEHFRDLPMLFTDDYSELTPDYLEEQYARMLETDYAIEKLYMSYWRRKIEDAIARHGASSGRALEAAG